MTASEIQFSIAAHAAWAPGLDNEAAWRAWSHAPVAIRGSDEPAVRAMPPMLRRRAGGLGKMALEVAYACMGERPAVPAVFCSRHGEVGRSLALLAELNEGVPLSPTAFGMSVHNATAGLWSIARKEQCSTIALAAGSSSVEHAVLEACSLLADGAPQVLLVVYDYPLPAPFEQFEDVEEQPHAWAWLIEPAGAERLSLGWSAAVAGAPASTGCAALPASLDVLRFFLSGQPQLVRQCEQRQWHWSRHV